MSWLHKVCPHCFKTSYTQNTSKEKWECPYCRKGFTQASSVINPYMELAATKTAHNHIPEHM